MAALNELMDANGFTGASLFYRATLPEFLTPLDDAGAYSISANDDPSESVVDLYAQGHIVLAQQVGPGLAFAQCLDNQWRGSDRKTVVVRVRDVLDQGGLIYPVESVITESVWYFTLPARSVEVKEVE
jgi:hypothetical protein